MAAKRAKATPAPETSESTEVVASVSYKDTDLKAIGDFSTALALAKAAHGELVNVSDELGDGFALLSSEHKVRLIGVPLLFMEWHFSKGDHGRFVSTRVVARNPDGGISKYIMNDGSTGICQQLYDYTEQTGRFGGLVAHNGLRVSEYEYETEDGEVKDAKTFYIDTSA